MSAAMDAYLAPTDKDCASGPVKKRKCDRAAHLKTRLAGVRASNHEQPADGRPVTTRCMRFVQAHDLTPDPHF